MSLFFATIHNSTSPLCPSPFGFGLALRELQINQLDIFFSNDGFASLPIDHLGFFFGWNLGSYNYSFRRNCHLLVYAKSAFKW